MGKGVNKKYHGLQGKKPNGMKTNIEFDNAKGFEVRKYKKK